MAKKLIKWLFIALIIGLGRLFFQRNDLAKLTKGEKLYTIVIYVLAMFCLIYGGALLKGWIDALHPNSWLRGLLFYPLFAVWFILVYVVLAKLLPDKLAEE